MSKPETLIQEPKKAEKEITYQVGWKKGKIRYQASNAQGLKPTVSDRDNRDPSFLVRQFRRWLWREAPYPREAGVRIALYVLPIVTFAAVLWLVFILSNTH